LLSLYLCALGPLFGQQQQEQSPWKKQQQQQRFRRAAGRMRNVSTFCPYICLPVCICVEVFCVPTVVIIATATAVAFLLLLLQPYRSPTHTRSHKKAHIFLAFLFGPGLFWALQSSGLGNSLFRLRGACFSFPRLLSALISTACGLLTEELPGDLPR